MTDLPARPTMIRKSARIRLRWLDIQENITGYLFICPAVLIIALFGFFPIGYAFYMSLYTWRVKQGPYVGDANYLKAIGEWAGAAIFVGGWLILVIAYLIWTRSRGVRATPGRIAGGITAAGAAIFGGWIIQQGWARMSLAGDESFLNTLPLTLYYSLGTVPAELAIALVLAYLLFQKIRGKDFFRMIYFLPYITPVVATAVVFRSILSSRETSLANQIVGLVGAGPFKWLFESKSFNQVVFGLRLPDFWNGPSMALVSIMIFGIWTFVGYNTVIYLAGLGSIPHELYEAAEIDGAGKWQLFRYITIPLLSPVTFYLAIVAFIGTFKAFNHIYVMRLPQAQGTVDVASVSIFDTFYKANQYGYAASQAILLFLIILGLTLIQNKVFGEKVFYG